MPSAASPDNPIGWKNTSSTLWTWPLVNADAVRAKRFKVAVDAVNSSGGIIVPMLLEALGCEVVKVHCDESHLPTTPSRFPRI